ncbi:hypothetical protein RZS08_05040, partial [Arthrospira platensis SPKY1]|nr:hypothetical protein [Arthrospira platensis SPKY1]
DRDQVLPISARQALLARAREDDDLLARSRVPELEALISERLLTRKERLVSHELVSDILGMLQTSTSILSARQRSLQDRLESVREQGIGPDYLKDLSEKTRKDHAFYYKKLFT